MERDVDDLLDQVNDLQLGMRALQSRLRLLETRLRGNTVMLGNDKGGTAQVKLSQDRTSLEVK